MLDRSRDLRRLSCQQFDLLVVGGGITGAGIARDAALRGLRVAVIDKNDFGSGTSSKSSKLVHGGLRYLQQAQLKLVFEGTNERALLMRMAPHLVRPQEFLLPAYRPGFMALISAGLVLYDLLALGKPPAGHRRYWRRQLIELEPLLRRDHLVGGLVYYDCATDDARLTLENVLDAAFEGATCVNYVRATGPLRRRGDGRVIGIEAEDVLGGSSFPIHARVVVCALGPWTDQVLEHFGRAGLRPLLRPTKGIHLIVDRKRLPIQRAVTMASRDGRVVFAIPSGPRTILGTTDTDYRGDYDALTPSFEEVVYLLASANLYFPDSRLRPDDIISTYAGLRPLIGATGSTSDVPREHEIFTRKDGLIFIAGGKLTTYRRMAREVVDRAVDRLGNMGFDEDVRPCQTGVRPLPRAFAPGTTAESETARIATRHGLDPDIAGHLVGTYGRAAEQVLSEGSHERIDPELPYLWCEVRHAILREGAVTLDDVLRRRVPLFLQARDQGLSCADAVLSELSTLCGHSANDRSRDLARYEDEVARSRAFRWRPVAARTGTDG